MVIVSSQPMKYFLILWFSATLLVACESDTEPTEKVSFKQEPSVALTGGGRWFEATDTGTYYDVNVNFTIVNPTSQPLRFTYFVQVGVDDDGVIRVEPIYTRSGTEIYSDTLTVGANSELTVNKNYVMDLARDNWTNPYRYWLLLRDPDGNPLLDTSKILSITERDRFCGVTFTNEQSPDPLGMLDAPDDGDFSKPSEAVGFLTGIFPNPTTVSATTRFQLNAQSQVRLWIAQTPATVLFVEIDNELLQPGFYDVNTLSMPPGQNRVYLEVVNGSRRDTTYADVIRSIN